MTEFKKSDKLKDIETPAAPTQPPAKFEGRRSELYGARVVVRREKAAELTEKGIHLPSASSSHRNVGPVVQAGDGSKFKAGDVVEWAHFAGIEGLEAWGPGHLVLDDADVMFLYK